MIIFADIKNMGGNTYIRSPSDNDSDNGLDYSSRTDVLLADGTKRKQCGCILYHIYKDVDRPFMCYTIDRLINMIFTPSLNFHQ